MSSEDIVRASAAAGRVVVWEEVARDGAQAKTLDAAFAGYLDGLTVGR